MAAPAVSSGLPVTATCASPPWIDSPTGVLFPIQPGVSGTDPAAATPDDADPEATGDEDEDPLADADGAESRSLAGPVRRRRRYVPPSAVGFSCFVRGATHLSITVGAATYSRVGDRDEKDGSGRWSTSGARCPTRP